jgi:hypothetical protein
VIFDKAIRILIIPDRYFNLGMNLFNGVKKEDEKKEKS